jgi:hypothetical protein
MRQLLPLIGVARASVAPAAAFAADPDPGGEARAPRLLHLP